MFFSTQNIKGILFGCVEIRKMRRERDTHIEIWKFLSVHKAKARKNQAKKKSLEFD